MLFAYSDGANVHIADVEFGQNTAPGAGTSTDSVNIVAAHDVAQLTGVASVTALNAHNIHFLA